MIDNIYSFTKYYVSRIRIKLFHWQSDKSLFSTFSHTIFTNWKHFVLRIRNICTWNLPLNYELILQRQY